MKKSDTPAAVGGSSLLVIFTVLCLTVFAVLSLSSVQAEGRLSKASGAAVQAYYKADCEAEEILAQLRAGIVPEGVTAEGNRYLYECVVSDTQTLVVEVEVTEANYRILRWQTESGGQWLAEDELNVWNGSME